MSPKSKSSPSKEKNCPVGDGLRDASSQTPVDPHDINEILVFISFSFQWGNLIFFFF